MNALRVLLLLAAALALLLVCSPAGAAPADGSLERRAKGVNKGPGRRQEERRWKQRPRLGQADCAAAEGKGQGARAEEQVCQEQEGRQDGQEQEQVQVALARDRDRDRAGHDPHCRGDGHRHCERHEDRDGRSFGDREGL
ncbi:hypothetical protein DFJ74DRAFT_698291, partial [Hyaloraphidium curvatum]